jgi:hypothetical protein
MPLLGFWDAAIKELLSGKASFKSADGKWLYSSDQMNSNYGPYFRLQEFYSSFSSAVEGKLDDDWRENIVSHMGELLFSREVTLKKYRQTVHKIQTSTFLDADNSVEAFQDLSTLSMALHKEAAALYVLAQSFRISKG